MRKFLVALVPLVLLAISASVLGDVHRIDYQCAKCGEHHNHSAASAVPIIQRNGQTFFLTAGHVSERPRQTVWIAGRPYPVTWLALEYTRNSDGSLPDLALLSVKYSGPIKLERIGSVRAGETVLVNGWPGGKHTKRTARVLRVNGWGLTLNQPSKSGDSGGGIFNSRGELVGITSFTTQWQTGCSSHPQMRKFVSDNRPGRGPNFYPETSPAVPSDALTAYVVFSKWCQESNRLQRDFASGQIRAPGMRVIWVDWDSQRDKARRIIHATGTTGRTEVPFIAVGRGQRVAVADTGYTTANRLNQSLARFARQTATHRNLHGVRRTQDPFDCGAVNLPAGGFSAGQLPAGFQDVEPPTEPPDCSCPPPVVPPTEPPGPPNTNPIPPLPPNYVPTDAIPGIFVPIEPGASIPTPPIEPVPPVDPPTIQPVPAPPTIQSGQSYSRDQLNRLLRRGYRAGGGSLGGVRVSQDLVNRIVALWILQQLRQSEYANAVSR